MFQHRVDEALWRWTVILTIGLTLLYVLVKIVKWMWTS